MVDTPVPAGGAGNAASRPIASSLPVGIDRTGRASGPAVGRVSVRDTATAALVVTRTTDDATDRARSGAGRSRSIRWNRTCGAPSAAGVDAGV
jgi:hypothetical protein